MCWSYGQVPQCHPECQEKHAFAAAAAVAALAKPGATSTFEPGCCAAASAAALETGWTITPSDPPGVDASTRASSGAARAAAGGPGFAASADGAAPSTASTARAAATPLPPIRLPRTVPSFRRPPPQRRLDGIVA